MFTLIHGIGKVFAAVGLTLAGLFGYHLVIPAPIITLPAQTDYSLDISHLKQTVEALTSKTEPVFGATNKVPDTVALLTTSLQSGISSTQTTMTLVSALYNNGASTLASSTYGFIIDEGTSVQEIVKADCTGTVCTNMDRGLDRLTGTTTVAALGFAHRRGASVKITDAPTLLILNRLVQGYDLLPNVLHYVVGTTCTASNLSSDICPKSYTDSVASAGAADSGQTTKGLTEEALNSEAASGAADGSGNTTAPLGLTASIASSVRVTNTARVVVSTTTNGGNGTISANFIDQEGGATYNFAASTTHAGPFNVISYQTATSAIFSGPMLFKSASTTNNSTNGNNGTIELQNENVLSNATSTFRGVGFGSGAYTTFSPFVKSNGVMFTDSGTLSGTTSVFSIPVQANTLIQSTATSTAIVGELYFDNGAGGSMAQNAGVSFCLNYAATNVVCASLLNSTGGSVTTVAGVVHFVLYGGTGTSNQEGSITISGYATGANGISANAGNASFTSNTGVDQINAITSKTGSSAVDSTQYQSMSIQASASSGTFKVTNGWAAVMQQ